MLRFRFFFSASLIAPALLTLSPLPLLADSWDNLATISAEPTARYVCYGNADGKNITCDSAAPYVDATGKVGIGTATPSTALSFGGDAARTVGMERGTVAATAGYALTLQAGGATSGSTDKAGGDLVFSSGTATGTGTSKIQFKTHPAGSTGTVDTTATTAMTILGSGYVGISQTNPQAALHVNGQIRVYADSNGLYLANSGNTRAMEIFTTTGGDLFFQGYNGTAWNEWVRLTSSGNVGIGSTSPAHKLDVNGNIGLAASGYVNWAATDGSTGYGFRDNAGALEFKNSGGSWTPFGTSSSFAAGTVSAPGLYVTGDSDTGFYQATANTLSITAGGVEAARFNTATSGVNYLSVTPSATGAAVQLAPAGSDTNISLAIMPKGSGGVGIGTASPAASLHILGGQVILQDTYAAYSMWKDGTPSKAGQMSFNAANGGIADGIGFNLFDGTSWSNKMVIAPSGNVGIGTAGVADLPLHITNSESRVRLQSTATNGRLWDIVSGGGGAAGAGAFVLQDNGYTRFVIEGAGTSEAMRINSSGNVGIGTTSPVSKLQVGGRITAVDAASAWGGVFGGWGGSKTVVIGNHTGVGMVQGASDALATAVSTLSLNPIGGNVGIGTTSPAAKLDVSGDVKVAGTGSETCATAADLGKIRLNPSTGRIQICRQ